MSPTGIGAGLEEASGWAAGAGAVSNFSAVSPWNGIGRCNVWDDGTVTATHGARCYTDTDVTNMGQAMVSVPPFYSYVDTTKIADGTTPRVALGGSFIGDGSFPGTACNHCLQLFGPHHGAKP